MKEGFKKFLRNQEYIELQLGSTYIITFEQKNVKVKFVKVTTKGYNFLIEDENRIAYIGRHYYKHSTKNNLYLIPKRLRLI